MNNIQLSCKSVRNALEITNVGLDEAYKLFEFERSDKIIHHFKEL